MDSVNDTLIQVRTSQTPNPAGKHDVVAVVHLGEVIKGAGLFWVRQDIAPPIVLNLNKSFFDVNVRRPILAHSSEFDEMALRSVFSDRIKNVEGADDVICLGQN